MSDDRDTGIYRKFEVRRVSDPTGKHARCEYFVLDRVHDPYAEVALRAYADACEGEYPNLAADIRTGLDEDSLWLAPRTPDA